MSILVRLLRRIDNIKIQENEKRILSGLGKSDESISIGGGCRFKGLDCIFVGEECYFGPNCRVEAWKDFGEQHFSPRIVIGKRVRINSNCHIGSINQIEIGDGCLLGSNVMIIDHAHGGGSAQELLEDPTNRELCSKGPISIGARTWICENAVILPNVRIGEGCTIGANAVVTHDVPDFSTVVGNPAKIVKTIDIKQSRTQHTPEMLI